MSTEHKPDWFGYIGLVLMWSLCIYLIVSAVVNYKAHAAEVVRYTDSEIAILTNQINQNLENEVLSVAADQMEQLIHMYRVNDGLDSTGWFDLALALRKLAEEQTDWEEADKWGTLVSHVAIRNTDLSTEEMHSTITSFLYMATDECAAKDYNPVRYSSQREHCVDERYYRADSWIRAFDMQEAVISRQVNDAALVAELIIQYDMSIAMQNIVHGVDGDEDKYEFEYDAAGEVTNVLRTRGHIREHYDWRTYAKRTVEILKELERFDKNEIPTRSK